MNCFVDTSAFLAVLNISDKNHDKAKVVWTRLIEQRAVLVTSNYVVLETLAVLQNRQGLRALQMFHGDVYPVLTVEWVSRETHERGMAGVLASSRRDLSVVDCVSFDVMRQLGVRSAFAFDKHFDEQGFDMVP
jgi:predicted nucleic acid-binding protein